MQGQGTLNPEGRNEHNRRGLRANAVAHKSQLSDPVHPAQQTPGTRLVGAAVKYARCHPKTGELCLCRPKPGETPVEGRSGSDVQIDRQT